MDYLLCFSHLSWNFVYQRPQHLLTRFSKEYQVFYFEEPKIGDCDRYIINIQDNVYIVELIISNFDDKAKEKLQGLVSQVLQEYDIKTYLVWYYTPMALQFTYALKPEVIIYDSMDELSAFRFAPPQLLQLEEELFRKADAVFTGGNSLYNAKKHRHHNIHSMPSSIDKSHFEQARGILDDPQDQASIGYPRMGFFGVIDERFDTDLLRNVAVHRPEWQFVMIGPVVKIDPEILPKAPNIHYLGPKTYAELPSYISHWDIALLLFALNESTEFISPTKTPEYLAAGKPVISTAIRDVVYPYGNAALVKIIDDAESFITEAESILIDEDKDHWLRTVDHFLEDESWDNTYDKMNTIIKKVKINNLIKHINHV